MEFDPNASLSRRTRRYVLLKVSAVVPIKICFPFCGVESGVSITSLLSFLIFLRVMVLTVNESYSAKELAILARKYGQ